MRIRQSELRKLWHRKKEAHKLRVLAEGGGVKAAVRPPVAEKPAEVKPKPPRKKKEESTEE